jgi:hypothetical protein
MAEMENEHVIRTESDRASVETVEAIQALGGHVRHRFGSILVVNVPRQAEETIRKRLPAGARLLPPEEIDQIRGLGDETIESIALAILRRRRSAEFRQSKRERPQEGEEWGTGDLPEPDVWSDVLRSVAESTRGVIRGQLHHHCSCDEGGV